MSYAMMNLWIRDAACNPLKDCWMFDLVIQSCNGTYLADVDEKLLSNLQARYPNYTISILPNYMSYTRVRFIPPAGEHIYHLEIDLVPGCWKVWGRVCHGQNEETNKVFVIAHCDDHLCVNLLLNAPNICSKHDVFPIAIAALQAQVDQYVVQDFLRVMRKVAYVQKADLLAWINDRLNELNDPTIPDRPTHLIPVNEQLRSIIEQMPEEPFC